MVLSRPGARNARSTMSARRAFCLGQGGRCVSVTYGSTTPSRSRRPHGLAFVSRCGARAWAGFELRQGSGFLIRVLA